jgi:hypothetical protein
VLGLTDDEFYSLTPFQFHLLLDQHEVKTKHQELLFGIVSSTVANYSMVRGKAPVSAKEFMPSSWGKDKPAPVKKLTKKDRQKIADNLRMTLAPFVSVSKP